MAEERGMFAARDIVLKTEEIGDGAVATRRLREGSLDISLSPPDGVIVDFMTGGPLRVIGGSANGLSHCLMTLPRFRKIEDLKGAHVGCISMTEGSTFHFQEVAARFGLRYPGDYDLDPVGGAPTRHKMLLEGTIDAGLQSIPFTYMEEEAGLNNLAKISDYVPDYQFNAINAHKDWAARNAALVSDFLAVMIEATKALYTDKAAAADVASRHMNIDMRFAERAWDDFTSDGVLPRDLGVNLPGMDKVAELMRKAKVLPADAKGSPRECVDLSYRDAALAKLAA